VTRRGEGADGNMTLTSVDERTLRIAGEIDIDSAPTVDAALRSMVELGGRITVDLAAVTFIDSSGIRSLLSAARGLDGRGMLVLHHPGPFVVRVLEVAGLIPAPPSLPIAYNWDGTGLAGDGPGAVHRLTALIGCAIEQQVRARSLVRRARQLRVEARSARARGEAA
jgi:anti-sigma B factor antagonist